METSAPLDARLTVNLMLTIHIYGVFSSNHTTFTFEKNDFKERQWKLDTEPIEPLYSTA